MNVSIYINGQSIDLGEAEYDVSLSISDIQDIKARKSGKTILIKVPATDNNKKIFQHYDSNVIGKSNDLLRGRLVSGGLTLDGDTYIYESINENGFKYYQFQIVFDNVNWINDIGENLLSDLDLSDFDHTHDTTDVSDSWTVTEDSTYSYPICDYGGGFASTDTPIEVMRPAYRISKLIERIYQTAGYRLESDFFRTDYFKSLWLLNPRDFYIDADPEDYTFKAYKSTTQTIYWNSAGGTTFENYIYHKIELSSMFFDSIASDFYDAVNSRFTSDVNLKMWLNLNIILDVKTLVAAPGGFNRRSQILYGQPSGASGVNYWTSLDGYLTTGVRQKVFNIIIPFTAAWSQNFELWLGLPDTATAGEIEVKSFDSSLFTTLGLNANTNIRNSIIDIDNIHIDGTPVDAASTLKSIKQIDLIKGLKQLFNLYFYCNEAEKKVYVEPFNTFYTGASQDWSDKLDELEEIELSYVDNKRNTIFKYKDDSTDYTHKDKDYSSLGGFKKSQLNVNAIDDDEVENDIFAWTNMAINADDRSTFGEYPYPSLRKEDGTGASAEDDAKKVLDVEPRILYYSGTPTASNAWTIEGDSFSVYPHFYSHNLNEDDDKSLSFKDIGNSKGLFSRYYDNMFKIYDGIYDTMRVPQLLRCSLRLNESDISNIVNAVRNRDLRTCIYLDKAEIRGHYYIQEIENYNPDKSVCKCTLVRVLDRSAGFNLLQPAILGDFNDDFNDDFLT